MSIDLDKLTDSELNQLYEDASYSLKNQIIRVQQLRSMERSEERDQVAYDRIIKRRRGVLR